MLVNLCDYKQSVTLIANSGVQFLDFGLTPQESAHLGRFVRKTANGPLLRLDFDLTNGRYTVPGRTGGQPEVVNSRPRPRRYRHRRDWSQRFEGKTRRAGDRQKRARDFAQPGD